MQQCSSQHCSAHMVEQTHMNGQNCPIVQKEKFMDDLSNKQVLITGICWLQQFFGVWETDDRGLSLLLLWPLSLAIGKDLVDWESLGGELIILIYFFFLESWAWELFLILLLFFSGRVASSTILLFYRANTTWIWREGRL